MSAARNRTVGLWNTKNGAAKKAKNRNRTSSCGPGCETVCTHERSDRLAVQSSSRHRIHAASRSHGASPGRQSFPWHAAPKAAGHNGSIHMPMPRPPPTGEKETVPSRKLNQILPPTYLQCPARPAASIRILPRTGVQTILHGQRISRRISQPEPRWLGSFRERWLTSGPLYETVRLAETPRSLFRVMCG